MNMTSVGVKLIVSPVVLNSRHISVTNVTISCCPSIVTPHGDVIQPYNSQACRLQNAGFEKYELLKDNVLGEISL